MRSLVTGASGHLGAALVRTLLERGHEVSALVPPGSELRQLAPLASRVRIIFGDLSDLHSSADEIIDAAPQVVYHLAWFGVTAEHRNDPNQVTINVAGTMALYDIAKTAGCECFVGVGSQAEYGPYDGVLSEDTPTRPVTAYGVCKLCCGLLLQKLCELSKTRCVWVRLLASYGPGDDPRRMIPSVISTLLSGQIPALTMGEQRTDYLYVDDAAAAIESLAATPGAGGVYNLSSGQSLSVRRIVEQIRDLIDPALPLGFGQVPYRHDQVMNLAADISRIRSATGWSPTTTLHEGLQRTIEWYKAQRCETAGAVKAAG
jgi:nucleoside-diphosphate-sugar epimerase